MGMLGRLVIFFSCSLIGITIGFSTHRRREMLVLSAELIGEMSARLGFCLKPAGELVSELSGQHPFCSLPYLKKFCSLPEDTPFPIRWEQAVEQTMDIRKQDKVSLLHIGHVLGAYDLPVQLRELEEIRRRLLGTAEQLSAQEERERKLYTALGPLIGLAVCILI